MTVQFWFKKHNILKNKSGVAALEFALIVPFMIALYMGAVEFGQALSADRKVTSVASATADLVAQSQEISQNDIDDIFRISRAVMQPFDDTTLRVIISSVVVDEDNNQSIDWSVSNVDGNAHAQGSQIPGMPATITEPNTSVIVAEVAYTYTSLVTKYISGPIDLTDTFYLRPRQSFQVEYTN